MHRHELRHVVPRFWVVAVDRGDRSTILVVSGTGEVCGHMLDGLEHTVVHVFDLRLVEDVRDDNDSVFVEFLPDCFDVCCNVTVVFVDDVFGSEGELGRRRR